MSLPPPRKVLIAGGKAGGGVAAFAEGLRSGFSELGIPADVAPANNILYRFRELRDPEILKILSLSALFAAPIARRAICVAHGFPCAKYQGWLTTLAILASLRVATASRGTQLVVVSEYSALHLNSIFGLRVDAVVHNPVQAIFLEGHSASTAREAITYVGRLHCSKHVDRLLPAIQDVLDENPGMRAWIIGEGSMRQELESIVSGDERFEFLGKLEPMQVRERLRRTRVFVSGNPTEPFGIAYLEALSQGCAVAMPASGGGLEIAPDCVGRKIHLFGASLRRGQIVDALRRALTSDQVPVCLETHWPHVVAKTYLNLDECLSPPWLSASEADG